MRNGSIATKHVFAGNTRVASKLSPGEVHVEPGNGTGPVNARAKAALNDPAFGADRAAYYGRRAGGGNNARRFECGAHPGQGRENRSETAGEHARDVEQNPHLADCPEGGLPERNFLYFYHPDHLGSTSYVTDGEGQLYEHVAYFPFGETWVDQRTETKRVPYLFTGKELDEETGLYYYGARYYDPRTSVWQSADSILGKYLPKSTESVKLEFGAQPEWRYKFALPGRGGVYNSVSLGSYTYSGQNPINFLDPDGKELLIKGNPRFKKQNGLAAEE